MPDWNRSNWAAAAIANGPTSSTSLLTPWPAADSNCWLRTWKWTAHAERAAGASRWKKNARNNRCHRNSSGVRHGATVAYDDALGMLQLEFRSRAIYQYFGVPVAVHEELLGAPSKGSYFNRVIRGHFPYSLILNRVAGTSNETLRPEGAR